MKRVIAVLMALFLLVNISALADTEKVSRIEFISYVMNEVGSINSINPVEFSDMTGNDRYYKRIQ